jgi:hypothetical protein
MTDTDTHKAALLRAQQGLEIQDVYQLQTESHLTDDGQFPSAYPERVGIQFKYNPLQSAVVTGDENGIEVTLFFVDVEVGARMIRDDDSHKKGEYLAQIEAKYRAIYRLKDKELAKDNEALDAFAQRNIKIHVWPFWREFAMTQSQRMNLPKLAIPMQMH